MKKLLCIILCICINLSCISAFPTEENKENKCGENVIWKVKDGVLTISGTEKMYDYSQRKSYPDDSFRPGSGPWGTKGFTKVVIEEGVTRIGNSAFAGCRDLSEIVISESIEEIGLAAFYFCENLKKINIHKNVRILECFKEYGVEYSVFTGSYFEEINVSKDNQHFSSVDGVLYNKEQTKLIKYPTEKKDESFIMSENVESIEENRLINGYLNYLDELPIKDEISVENPEVCVYNNKIYYVDATGKNIYRCDMDGTNKILITDSAAQGKKFIMSNFVVFAGTSESGGGIYMVHPDTQYWARIIKDKEVSLEYCRDNYIYYNVYGNYYKMSCCVDISAPITYEELTGIMKN